MKMEEKRFHTSKDALAGKSTDLPLLCVFPSQAEKRANDFCRQFNGTMAYSVKTNPDESVLKAIASGAQKAAKKIAFDVASIPEIELTKCLFPDAQLYFMHPMKKESWIHRAYHDFGVRHFVVDHPLELQKFRAANYKDLTIFVRFSTIAGDAKGSDSVPAYNLSAKFGAAPEHAIALLKAVSDGGHQAALAFHVGSQNETSANWKNAFDIARRIIGESTAKIGTLDIGGGMPGGYGSFSVGDAQNVTAEVVALAHAFGRELGLELIAEPGRAIVFDSMSVVAEIIGRREPHERAKQGDPRPILHIDEGIWSSLQASLTASLDKLRTGRKPTFQWPTRAHMGKAPEPNRKFEIMGVTCDSVDVLFCDYELPGNIGIGDHIEFGHAGAYGTALRNRFNGFGEHERVLVDTPFSPL